MIATSERTPWKDLTLEADISLIGTFFETCGRPVALNGGGFTSSTPLQR
jgi:hypothetical protein